MLQVHILYLLYKMTSSILTPSLPPWSLLSADLWSGKAVHPSMDGKQETTINLNNGMIASIEI